MAVRPKYRYTSLDGTGQEIRLLSLQPRANSSQLQCTLSTKSLAGPGPYEALLYVWGDKTERLPLIIDGSELQITRNLGRALRHLRFEDKPRILWVDAICINQEDDEERSSQVQQMRYTYDKAEQVIMWLGRETSDSHLAMELIQELKMEKISKVSVLDSLQDIRKREKWMAFMKLCARKYWSRLWILQEVASVPKNVVYIGKQLASWDDIGSVAATITNDLRSAWSSFGFMMKGIFRLVDIESLYRLYSMSRRGAVSKFGSSPQNNAST